MTAKVLVNVDRNNVSESAHRGWVVACDNRGKILAGTHKKFPDVFARSSIKPVQALPFLFADGLETFSFGIKELSVMCSSHSGEEIHVKTVSSILKKIKLTEKHLKCGIHNPYGVEANNHLIKTNTQPSEIHCNCSGKHSGMLAACLISGWTLHDYYDYNHPLQKEIRQHIQNLTGLKADNLNWGIDGCGVPTYSMPLNKIAEIFAKISNPNHDLSPKYQQIFNLIKEAFFEYPEIIAGTNRVDTQIMSANKNKYISKIGGEAVLALGIPNEKKAFAIKIEDGANRPLLPVIIKTLELLKQDVSNPELQKLAITNVENNSKQVVGKVYPVFSFI